MWKILPLLLIGISVYLDTIQATPPSSHGHGHGHGHQPQPTIIIKPQPTGVPLPTLQPINTCPAPSEAMLRCLRQWACQYIIRLDLRCLLNLNGNPLLGGVLGGGTSPAIGGTGGTGGGGLLGGILGL